MDVTTLFNLSYGLYVIGVKDGGRNVGCLVNTVSQATAQPVTLTVCINKNNYTNECIKKTKEFAVSILSENAKEDTFGIFGFSSGKDRDKFAEVPHGLTSSGQPYMKEGVTGYIQCRVINFVDNYTHTIFIAEVQEAENLSKEPPMTYAYYHKAVKGKTSKNAPTYVADTDKKSGVASYVCIVCRYEYPDSKEEFEKLPEEYQCPICRAAKSKFIPN